MNNNSDKKERYLMAGVASVAFLGVLFGYLTVSGQIDLKSSKIAQNEPQIEVSVYIAPRDIQAKSLYIYDLALGEVIYSKNEEAQWPLASITKIMTAIVAVENASPSSIVRIEDTLLKERGGGDIRAGELWDLKSLINYSLLVSSNDGARAIASAVGSFSVKDRNISTEEFFIEKMNEKAKEIGLSQTYFINESGLDLNNNISGAYGSAKDSALLMSYAYEKYPETIEATGYQSLQINSLSGIRHDAVNSNLASGEISGLSASKTGFTDIAGGNVVFIFEAGPMRPIVVSLLGSGKDERFEDAKKIHASVIEYLSRKTLNQGTSSL